MTPQDPEAHAQVVSRLRTHWGVNLGQVRVNVQFPTKSGNVDIREEKRVYFADETIRNVTPEAFLDRLIDLSTELLKELDKLYQIAGNPDRPWINEQISLWEQYQKNIDQLPTDAEKNSNLAKEAENYWGHFVGLNYYLQQVIVNRLPELSGKPETAKLTAAQRAELREFARTLNHNKLLRGYEAITRWVEQQQWIAPLAKRVKQIDTAVEEAYRGTGRTRPETFVLTRLKTVSKLLSLQKDFDKLNLLFTTGQRIRGVTNQSLFALFIKMWDELGWSEMMNVYRAHRVSVGRERTPRYSGLTERNFVEYDPSTQLHIALQVAQPFQDRLVTLRIIQAEVREIFATVVDISWWAFQKAVLKRVPGWASVKLVAQNVADLIDAYSAPAR